MSRPTLTSSMELKAMLNDVAGRLATCRAEQRAGLAIQHRDLHQTCLRALARENMEEPS